MSMTSSTSMAARALGNVATSSRCFTTSAAVLAGGKGPKKTNVQQAGKKKMPGFGGGNSKNKVVMGPMNRGIRLTYAMASDPPDLQDFEAYPSGAINADQIGKPTVLAKQVYDNVQTWGLPRNTEREFVKSGGPASVVRQGTIDLANTLQREAGSSSQNARYLLSGDQGSGKSILMLQAVAQAIASGYIVIYAPRAQSWTNSSSPYAYNAESKIFDQPAIAASILDNLVKVHGSKLAQVKIGKEDLSSYIKSVARDETRSVQGLEKVMEALSEQTQFPVLFAIDEVHALFTMSEYRTPTYELIQSYHLSTPRLALDYLTGRKTFARGMTLSAYSHTTPNLGFSTDFLYALELPSVDPITPYAKFEQIHLAHASSGMKKIEVPFGMTTKEAVGMFEIWSRKGLVPKASDEVFMGAYMAAAGNPKELSREWSSDRHAYERFDSTLSV